MPLQVALCPARYDEQAISSAPAAASSTGRADGGTAAVIRTEELTKVYPGTDFAAVDGLNLPVSWDTVRLALAALFLGVLLGG